MYFDELGNIIFCFIILLSQTHNHMTFSIIARNCSENSKQCALKLFQYIFIFEN